MHFNAACIQEPLCFQINLLQCQKHIKCACDNIKLHDNQILTTMSTQIKSIFLNHFNNYCQQLRIQRKLIILAILKSYDQHQANLVSIMPTKINKKLMIMISATKHAIKQLNKHYNNYLTHYTLNCITCQRYLLTQTYNDNYSSNAPSSCLIKQQNLHTQTKTAQMHTLPSINNMDISCNTASTPKNTIMDSGAKCYQSQFIPVTITNNRYPLNHQTLSNLHSNPKIQLQQAQIFQTTNINNVHYNPNIVINAIIVKPQLSMPQQLKLNGNHVQQTNTKMIDRNRLATNKRIDIRSMVDTRTNHASQYTTPNQTNENTNLTQKLQQNQAQKMVFDDVSNWNTTYSSDSANNSNKTQSSSLETSISNAVQFETVDALHVNVCEMGKTTDTDSRTNTNTNTNTTTAKFKSSSDANITEGVDSRARLKSKSKSKSNSSVKLKRVHYKQHNLYRKIYFDDNLNSTKVLWECGLCGKQLSSQSGIITHIRSQHKHSIIETSKLERNKGKLGRIGRMGRLHSKTDTVGDARAACKVSNDIGGIMDHKHAVLLPNAKRYERYEVTSNYNYKCKQCNKIIKTRSGMISHSQAHLGIKNYQCQYCKLRFSGKTARDRHERLHTGEKPFQCQICFKRFTIKSGLKAHYVTHTKIKPFECDICHKKYTQSSSLRRHQKQHAHIQ